MKLAQSDLRRRFLNFVNVFLLFRDYLALEKGGTLHLKHFNTLYSRMQVWLKLAHWFWRRFPNFVNIFSIFRYYLPVALIWTNMNLLYPKMLCDKFGWNRLSGPGEENEHVKGLLQRQQWQQQRRLTTDRFWSKKLNWAFGLGELLTWNGKMSLQYYIFRNICRLEFIYTNLTNHNKR